MGKIYTEFNSLLFVKGMFYDSFVARFSPRKQLREVFFCVLEKKYFVVEQIFIEVIYDLRFRALLQVLALKKFSPKI